MSPFFNIDRSDFIATVTLQRTTMPPAFFTECTALFEDLSRDSKLRAVVIRGSAKAFSYGLDLKEAFAEHGPTHTTMSGGLAKPRTELRELVHRFQEAFTAIARCPVPVIAAVHGWCIGGGLDLISACDIRLCTRDARFSLRETKIAIVADVGSLQRLPAIIGKGNLRELAFTGKDIDAERALAMGLVNEVCDDNEALTAATNAMAEEIAANAPLTVRGVKQVLDYCEGKSIADGLEYVATWNSAFLASDDLGEAITAFVARRPPEFKGQ